jgi:hypothetical protein
MARCNAGPNQEQSRPGLERVLGVGIWYLATVVAVLQKDGSSVLSVSMAL